MDVQLDEIRSTLEVTPLEVAPTHVSRGNAERSILIYWVVSTVVGVVFLWDWLTAWNVPQTLAQPGLVTYLIATFALSQVLYVLVARHDNRPFLPMATVIFAIGNGIAETLAFAVVYRIGELLGTSLVGLFAPGWASMAGLVTGVTLFSAYGGIIHGWFWLKILPHHLDDSPRSQALRHHRPKAEVLLVLGWCLCFWLNRDIWTVIFIHTLVDVGLMLRVRPIIFAPRRLLV